MKQKNIAYIVAVIITVAVIVFLLKVWFSVRPEAPGKSPSSVNITPSEAGKKPVIYDIDKIKSQTGSESTKSATVSDMKGVYEQFPKEDVGNNIVEKWAMLKPEEKTVVREGIDKTIRDSEDALKINPADKTAKHKLAVSKILKRLAQNDFNYKAGEEWGSR